MDGENLTTPMMKQYLSIKKHYADCLLFYRMGDFYELFMEDAHIGAKVLAITLTGKSNGKNKRIPMAGVPYHAVDTYLHKLVKAGYSVAICEQTSPPTKYGLVDRAVVRIVTPGTILDEKSLETKENNYIVSILTDNAFVSVCAADISTGQFYVSHVSINENKEYLRDELARLHPAECILPPILYNNPDFLKLLSEQQAMNIVCYHAWDTKTTDAESVLKNHFNVVTLAGFGIHELLLAQQTTAALLGYLTHTQQGSITHMKKLTLVHPDETMQLDRATIINLELFSTIREHSTRGSLISVIDHTLTAMGGRMLRQWVRKPLTKREAIEKRHAVVSFFAKEQHERKNIAEKLKKIADIERMLARLSVGIGNARDLISLRNSLQVTYDIKKLVQNVHTPRLKELANEILPTIEACIKYITDTVKEEPGIDIRKGNLIQEGKNAELDTLRKTIKNSNVWIAELETAERRKTGIQSLKVRFNKIFGFYIEVGKAHAMKVPGSYIRKQTLVNGERFITEELKKQEEIILHAEERVCELEYFLFQEVLKELLLYTDDMQKAANSIAEIDCLVSFAYLAETGNYVQPDMHEENSISITSGRHPVVENLLESSQLFVPNDVTLDNTQKLLLITGPNMAGKSVLIRQTALIVLLAQIGSFVPAAKATLCVVDKIFVRSGASDVITSGLSTFMVEMVETAHILQNATQKSLIIMDEIGRGTSTYDGISIAWAVAEAIVKQKNTAPKTLFATHYHELQELEKAFPEAIKNFHMAVSDKNGKPIFLHTFLPGGASASFGIAVGELAGLPPEVIDRAKEILQKLEGKAAQKNDDKELISETNHDILIYLLIKELRGIDISHMTPLEALNKLAALKHTLAITQEEKEYFSE